MFKILDDSITNNHLELRSNDKKITEVIDKLNIEAIDYFMKKDELNDELNSKSLYEYISTESAYTTSPSLIRNAYLRVSMLLSADKGYYMAKYIDNFKNLDPNLVSTSPSKAVFDYVNVESFDKLMRLLGSITDNLILDSDIKLLIGDIEKDIKRLNNSFMLYLSLIGLPIVNVLALFYFLHVNSSVISNSAENNAKYGERVMKSLEKAIRKTKVAGIDISDPGSIIDSVNRLRQFMYPSSIKNSIRPKSLKPKKFVSYEDKLKIVNLLKDEYQTYQRTLTSKVDTNIDALRLVLKGSELDNSLKYINNTTSGSKSSIWGDLCNTLIMTIIEMCEFIIILNGDLKRY